jgi:predicted DNA-binding ribbon-helix-helix protein
LYRNKRVNSSRKFIDKELSNILDGGYKKTKNKFNKSIVTIDNIRRAIEQEKKFETDLVKIIDKLGSNIGNLVSRILNI